MHQKVIIVGGGCFGLSTALKLAKNGYHVKVLDRMKLPAFDAASTDINKCIRMDYGANEFYTKLGAECIEKWKKWNTKWSDSVYEECGWLVVSEHEMQEGSYEQDSYVTITKLECADLKKLDGDAIRAQFPAYSGNQRVRSGYYNPDGGFVKASEVMIQLAAECRNSGVIFLEGDAGHVDTVNKLKRPSVKTKDGVVHEADFVIVSSGAWSSQLLTELDGIVEAHGQAVFHFKVPDHLQEKYSGENFPPFAYDIGRTGFYGISMHPETKIVKIARHTNGYVRKQSGISCPLTSVEDSSLTVPAEDYERMRAFVSEKFPDLLEAGFYNCRMCWYYDTWDGDFLIDFVPFSDNVLVATGGSGHGFKFTPVIGDIVLDVINGRKTEATEAFKWRIPGSQRKTTAERMFQEDALEITTMKMVPLDAFSREE